MAFGHWMEIREDTAAGPVHLRLGPIRREDAKRFVATEAGHGMQSYEVTRYLGSTSTPTEEGELEWWDETSKDKDSLNWGIFVPTATDGENEAGWQLVGNTSLHFHRRDRRRAESGFLLFDRELWCRRIASTAHLGRTLFAFEELDLLAITSQAYSPNAGSNRALQGVGYVQTGTSYSEIVVGGQSVDTNVYLMPNPTEAAWRYFWRRPDEEIPTEFTAGRRRAFAALERAKAAVTFL